jgi:hypothetical protein
MPVVRKSCKRGCEILDLKRLFVIELAIPISLITIVYQKRTYATNTNVVAVKHK